MLKQCVAALILLGSAGFGPAQAAEALALKVLGFSPDGRYFGFTQYGGQGDHSEYIAELFIIDASRDRLVPGVPVRVKAEVKDENEEKELEALLAISEKRAAGLLKRHRISKPGDLLLIVENTSSGIPHSGSGGPVVGSTWVKVTEHPRLGEFDVKLAPKEIVWPKTSKFGSHKEAALCSQEVDWQKGAGFRLTLEHRNRTIVLNDDKTIPASRFCATGYGIVEVHAFDRPDGKVTLVIILGMQTRGFEGEDRVFLAVTRVLNR